MSYDNPNRQKYSFGNFDFGAGADETFSVRGPKGKTGRLYDYGVSGVIEVMNGGTVTPKVAIGSPSDPDAYGDELDLNAVADNEHKSVRSTYAETASGFTSLMVGPDIAADAEVVVTCTGATGSPTGQAVPFVVIDWAD
jgi:hypothetical protein